MRRLSFLIALAVCLGGASGVAQAQGTSWNQDVTTDTTWGDATNPCPIILERPVFVVGANEDSPVTLTILPGCVVRGQPRAKAPVELDPEGVPGSLIVTRRGRIIADGSEQAPIIFTTATLDDVAPFGAGDTFSVGGDTFFQGVDCNPKAADNSKGPCNIGSQDFLDDDPLNDPLSLLDSQGGQNIGLWGGIAVLGTAPCNYGTTAALQGLGAQFGQNILEGVDFPGFPADFGFFCGDDPHDDSGVLEYVSIRHAGDSLNEGDELNCISLGGVGDATKISFVECLGNFDDGFEWFGGTVNGDHLAAFYIGDDTFDLDAGYTGINQFVFGVMTHFADGDNNKFGSKGGEKCTEWDGEDYAETNPQGQLVNIRPNPYNLGGGGQPWPYSNPLFYNFTCLGPDVPVDAGSNATAGNAAGVQMRNGFAGTISHSVIANFDTPALNIIDGDGSSPDWSPANNDGIGEGSNTDKGDVVSYCTTYDDVPALVGDALVAVATGNDRFATGADNNAINGPFSMVGENYGYNMVNASGKLSGINAAGRQIDPRPASPIGAGGCDVARGPGVDGVSFRGAFQAGQTLWTTGWSAPNKGGILAD